MLYLLLLLLLLDIEATHRECAQVPRRAVLRPDVAKLTVHKILHVEPIRVLQYRGIIGKAGNWDVVTMLQYLTSGAGCGQVPASEGRERPGGIKAGAW